MDDTAHAIAKTVNTSFQIMPLFELCPDMFMLFLN